ncbi:C4-dicarboxylate TRAP transporter substrate-binding protein [Marinobacter bryozoorum]|uniref:C4-dicarboxylate TRAP transporter substrate-binding protein n=1 Tax=Marinobacter bryozoorum TaxID=256324 RepID=UPI002004A979|nr:C4-dicarboxylate TRAP transporter substrate-binding protein [Marinobacter bryozoorum]MCK7545283.1 C4-dicarboxylate TRAP transporter substrate-binding protein [Marinobacter bryozoorum]
MLSRKSLLSASVLSASALTVAMLAAPAQARTLSYASVYPAGSEADKAVHEWAEKVEEYSDGDLKAKVFPMSLLSASEVSAGVRDGMADAGYLLTVYFPAEYPHINLINESAMQVNLIDRERLNGLGTYAFEGAITEFIFFKCPECLQELEAQNHVYTANVASSGYGMVCNEPVVKPEDMEGMRMRVAGSHWSRWVSEFGGSSVSMTISEIREGLSQGVLDCTISSLPEITNLNLTEVVTDVTVDLPGGIYAGSSGASVNKDVWASLSEDQRRATLKAGAYLTAVTPWRYEQTQDEALEAVRQNGGNIHNASKEFHEATEAFVKKDLETIVAYYQERHGVERGGEMLDEFAVLLDKWVDLVQGVESADELAEIYYDEIFAKVDVSKHGL